MPRTELDTVLAADPEAQYGALRDKALSALRDQFPIEGRNRVLEMERIWTDDSAVDPDDLAALKKARLAGKSWTVPIYGSMTLKDKATGKPLDQPRRVLLGHLPRPTPHYSYLVDGTEYQIGSQPRMKPGVYTRLRANGELEGHVNLARGRNFATKLNPDTGKLSVEVGSSNVALHPIMRALGASDQDMERAWGKEILEANRVDEAKADKELRKLYRHISREAAPENPEALRSAVRKVYDETEMSPEVTARTLGKSFSKVTPELLAATTAKMLRVSRGEDEVDDRDALVYQEIYGPEDLLDFNLRHRQTRNTIARKIKNRIDTKEKVRDIVGGALDQQLRAFFTRSSLSNATEENNPVSLVSQYNRVDPLGEGGISSTRAVPDEARDLNDSYMGFLDPLHTPESSKIGVTLHSVLHTQKAGHRLKARLLNVHSGRVQWVTPEDLADKVVAFPGQYNLAGAKPSPNSQRVKVMNKGRMDEVSSSSVDFVMPSPQGMFDLSTNMVPFLGSTQGTRGMTASKMLEQALPLVGREAPDVQVQFKGKRSFEDLVGEKFSVRAPIEGKVVEVSKDRIVVQAKNRKKITLPLHDHYPLNQKAFLHHEAIVAVGDSVKAGDVLADSNFTRNGTLSLGRGLNVAYMPWKGYTLEDASVISETAAKKLTSEHLHHKDIPIDDASVLDLTKFKAYYPDRVSRDAEEKMDAKGVVKAGMRVKPGEVIVAHMRQEQATPEDGILSRLHKSLVKPYKDRSIEWDHDFEGEVTDVVNLGNKLRVFLRTEEPARVGDKIAGRFGNKSVISTILPDAEMPQMADGDPVEVIFDSHTVPSRINPSQILESAAGRASHRLGRRFLVKNFDMGSALDKVRGLMREAKLPESGKEDLVDPETEKTIPGVFVGRQMIQKLKHQVEAKFAARNFEPGYDINEAPRGGSEHGAQTIDHLTLYSMLAHGNTRNLLREMSTDHKASRNPDLWRALQMGQRLPSPKPTFAFNKFVGMLQGMGVNVQKKRDGLSLGPMTDKDVLGMSRGALRNPVEMVRGKDLRPVVGGLFDPEATGGLRGEEWSHIDLRKPVPNPLLARGVQVLTGLTGTQYEDILSGRVGVNKSGDLIPMST